MALTSTGLSKTYPNGVRALEARLNNLHIKQLTVERLEVRLSPRDLDAIHSALQTEIPPETRSGGLFDWGPLLTKELSSRS